MDIFRTIGRKAEQAKRQVDAAAAETFECADCGAECNVDYEECPDCGSESVVDPNE